VIHLERTRFGTIELPEAASILLPKGLIGFANEQRFVIIERAKGPIAFLQSVNTPELSLPVINAALLTPPYPELAREELAAMINARPENIAILVVLAVSPDSGKLMANLLAPIIVDAETRSGAQIILDPNHYSANAPIAKAA
jgi:flagellar assembly factor FliW